MIWEVLRWALIDVLVIFFLFILFRTNSGLGSLMGSILWGIEVDMMLVFLALKGRVYMSLL